MHKIKHNLPIKDNIKEGEVNYIETSNFHDGFYYNSNFGNCKLCSLNYLSNNKIENLIPRIKELFTVVNKLCFQVNVIDYNIIKELAKEFQMIYCVEVPIGYKSSFNNGIQYYACFFTNSPDYPDNKKYKKRVSEQQEVGLILYNKIN